jgi:hypothetical protein
MVREIAWSNEVSFGRVGQKINTPTLPEVLEATPTRPTRLVDRLASTDLTINLTARTHNFPRKIRGRRGTRSTKQSREPQSRDNRGVDMRY